MPIEDIGPDGTVAVMALDRSDKSARVWRFESLEAARAAAVAEPTGGLYRDRALSLFAYAGGWASLRLPRRIIAAVRTAAWRSSRISVEEMSPRSSSQRDQRCSSPT